LIIVLLNWF